MKGLEDHAFDAAIGLDREALIILFDLGVSPKVTSESGQTLLHFVSFKDEKNREKAEGVAQFLLRKGVDPCAVDENGQSVIFYYCSGDDTINMTKYLLDRHIGVNYTDKHRDYSLLMMAALYGAKDTVKLLLERGADVSFRGKDGKTAMDMVRDGWIAAADKRRYGEVLAILKEAMDQAPMRKIKSLKAAQTPHIKRRGPKF